MRTMEEIIGSAKIIVAVNCGDFELAAKICEAVAQGGIKVLAFTMMSQKDFVVLQKLVNKFPNLDIGASRVIDAAGFLSASLAGAKFITSVGMNDELYSGVRTRYNDASFLPGVINPSQIMEAMSHGFKIMNAFPLELSGGNLLLRQYAETFPDIKFVARGSSIDTHNMDDYLQESNVIGVYLADIASPELVLAGKFDEITKRASNALNKARQILKV